MFIILLIKLKEMGKYKSSQELAKEVRNHSLKMVHRSKGSHIGSALSIADIVSVLYFDILEIDPTNYNNSERDIFILSKGHACVSLYSVLGLKGFFDLEELKTYGQNGSPFMNHISHKVPGVEFSTGSLGHGVPFALGKALGIKIRNSKNKVFVVVGDGELDEGSNWEAILFAAHNNISNLTIIVDYNNLQSLTTVDKTMGLEPLTDKFKAFGCNVFECDGHNHEQLRDVLNKIESIHEKPSVVICKTVKGKGVSFMENEVKWHYKNPNDAELEQALNEIKNA